MAGSEEHADLLIRGARIVDGTGGPARTGDVALRGDRIAAVGEVGGSAGASLDARGLVLAPGFIDVHTHDDFAVLLHPEMPFKLMQGVTTDVVGNCGLGAAPFENARRAAQAIHPGRRLAGWEGYAGYLAALDAEPPSCNVAVLVGHGTLREAAMGLGSRAPEAAELRRMQALLAEGIEAGCVGLSTGLIYEPGRHAATEEIVELARVMAGSGALYATHMRDEGAGLLDSVRETLAIGERAGVPVQVSHHKAAGREAWGLVRESLTLLEEARARGMDASADQYPYTAGSTILAAVVAGIAGRGPVSDEDAASVVIAACAGHPDYEGRSLRDLAGDWGVDAVAAARRVLEEEPATWVVMHSMSEDDVRLVLRHPSTMIGSDGVPTDGGKPHPRLYGTFARVLGHYCRREGVLSLEEAVHRMTGLPAEKFHLRDRGVVREGAFADLVLFDPETIDDVASYQDPRRHPSGIHAVFVNGTAVVQGGAHTGARPGRALRRG
jgi:N-acyl-D-amino-acid deacylase